MTHRIEVNVETGVTTIIEYTAEEQAAYDTAVAQQAAADLAVEQAATEAAQPPAQGA